MNNYDASAEIIRAPIDLQRRSTQCVFEAGHIGLKNKPRHDYILFLFGDMEGKDFVYVGRLLLLFRVTIYVRADGEICFLQYMDLFQAL